jgi:glycosyltransferase involved in cell wall biosynthesis
MKIALISHTFLPNIGGIEIYTYRLARDLKQKGEEVSVLSTDFSIKRKEKFSFPLYYFKAWPVILRNPCPLPLIIHLLKNQYEIIHLQSIWFFSSLFGAIFCKKAKIITTVHGTYPEKASPILKLGLYCFRPLARLILRRSSKIIALSEREKEKLVRLFKISPKNIEVISPGIDVQKPSLKIQKQLKKKYKILDQKIILFAGRIIPEKNPQLLIQALPYLKAKTKKIKILFVGPVKKDFKEKLLELAGKNKKDLIFTGPLHPIKEAEVLANFYALSDVSVALGEWEGLPIRVLEAKIYKTPVVENLKQPKELAEKILEALLHKQPEATKELGSHLWPNVFKDIYQLYLEVKKSSPKI